MLSVGVLSPGASANIETFSGNFRMDNWLCNSKGDCDRGDLIDPIILNYSLTFDTSMNVINSTAGLNIFYTNFPGPLSYSATRIGSLQYLQIRIGTQMVGYDCAFTTREICYDIDGGSGLASFVIQSNSTGQSHISYDELSLGPAGPVSGGVPEPATWMMIIAGFGVVCAAMRGRRAMAA